MFLQALADSTAYKFGYSVGTWLPFVLLGIGLTIMIMVAQRKNKKPRKNISTRTTLRLC
jgi:preprotein translocase subunit YajC